MPTVSNIPVVEMNEEAVITLENVFIEYRMPNETVSGIKEYAIRLAQRRLTYEKFRALEDISLQIQRGEVFGVIGRNGAGKTTLLKVIARVLHPSRGRIIIRGRVAPLLELGAGFHPELTGRENVYLNSALLGRSRKEVDRLLPDIVEFAEIEDFFDAPIRTYSTGMVARLGFSVATCSRPDILLVDEVLSVGDSQFQRKCLNRINSFQSLGTTIILVSHSMAAIETYCQRALWLQNGKAVGLGATSEVIKQYVIAERSSPVKVHPSPPVSGSTQPRQSSVSKTLQDYFSLTNIGEIYPSIGKLDVAFGSVSFWLMFRSDKAPQDAIIFHTDDSRYIIYVGTDFSPDLGQDVRQLVARAGGNRRSLDTFFGTAGFPEISTALDVDEVSLGFPFSKDEWHFVTVTWEGYPDGKLCLYIDGQLTGERTYDSRFDNGLPLPQAFAYGMRPGGWTGELIKGEDGTVVELRPDSTMALTESNLDIQDMRIYKQVLSPHDIHQLLIDRAKA